MRGSRGGPSEGAEGARTDRDVPKQSAPASAVFLFVDSEDEPRGEGSGDEDLFPKKKRKKEKKADCRAEAYFWGGGCESRYIHMC